MRAQLCPCTYKRGWQGLANPVPLNEYANLNMTPNERTAWETVLG